MRKELVIKDLKLTKRLRREGGASSILKSMFSKFLQQFKRRNRRRLQTPDIDAVVNIFTGQTALMVAAERGDIGSVDSLIARGARVNLTDFKGQTALMYAAKGGHKEITRLLLVNNARTEVRNRSGKTAIEIAASHGHSDVVKLLLSAGQSQQKRSLRFSVKNKQLPIARTRASYRPRTQINFHNGPTYRQTSVFVNDPYSKEKYRKMLTKQRIKSRILALQASRASVQKTNLIINDPLEQLKKIENADKELILGIQSRMTSRGGIAPAK